MAKTKSKSALNKMGEEKLIEYAMTEHGLVIDADVDTKDDIVEKILLAQEDEGADLSEDNSEVEDNQKASEKIDNKSKGEKRVWVKISNEEGEIGDKPVFVGCSGDEVLVHRDTWVHMKIKHLNQLKAAVETHFKDGVARDVPRYRTEVSEKKPEDAEG